MSHCFILNTSGMTNPKMKDTVMGKRRKDKVTSSGITKQSQCNKEKYKTKYGTKKTGQGIFYVFVVHYMCHI